MSPRTFSRKGRSTITSPPSAGKKSRLETRADPFDSIAEPEDCSDPLSPFFFGESDQEAPARAPPKARDSAKSGTASRPARSKCFMVSLQRFPGPVPPLPLRA